MADIKTSVFTDIIFQTLREKKKLEKALYEDLGNEALQVELKAFDSGEGEGWLPVGETGKLLTEMQPREGFSEFYVKFESAYHSAVRFEMKAVWELLDNVDEGQKELYRFAASSFEHGKTVLFSGEEWGNALTKLIHRFGLLDEVTKEFYEQDTERPTVTLAKVKQLLDFSDSAMDYHKKKSDFPKPVIERPGPLGYLYDTHQVVAYIEKQSNWKDIDTSALLAGYSPK